MTDIVLASHNRGKAAELRALLSDICGIHVLSLSDIEWLGDIEESGLSFVENSIIKASVPASLGYIGMADDSGLCVDALAGAPGIYSARYAGSAESGSAADAANRRKLLDDMTGIPMTDRGAAFVCVISLVLPEDCGLVIPERYRPPCDTVLPDGVTIEHCATVRGECRGVILTEEHGDGGFGYDSLFSSYELGMTFAEAPQKAKNRVSHRGRAMSEFIDLLRDIPGLL